MKTMKTTFLKFLAFGFALLIAAGCATVTDANLDLEVDEPTIATENFNGGDWFNRAGNSMDPILGDERDTNDF